MQDKSTFQGIATALITPFGGEGVDLHAFSRLVKEQIASGIHALVVAGTTGEASTLTEKERDLLLETALREAEGHVAVIMGTGANDTEKAVALTRRAAALGADGALCVTPYYNKGTRAGIRSHFLRIAEEGGLPLILYNVPSRTGVSLSLADYETLAAHPCIVAVKEADGDMEKMAALCALAAGKMRVYTGNDGLLLPSLAVGADGAVSVISNLLPRDTVQIFQKWQEGKVTEALSLFRRMLPLATALFLETNPAPIKYLMTLSDYGDGSLRLPLTRVTAATEEALLSAFAAWGEGE